jgi:integrase
VKNVFEAGKRRLSVPVTKKEPITSDIIRKMFSKFFISENIYNQRSICACLIAYAGFFLRSNELLNIRCSDVCFEQTHMTIFIEKSKTDIYRDGQHVVIARAQSELCPVRNLELYFSWCGFSNESSEYIFRNITKTKSGYKLRKTNKPLTYSRMRELFIEAFQSFLPDISKFGFHSLKADGATACANSGVSDRLFKRIGRWRSESAKDGYIKDNLDARLLVSLKLSL